MKKVTAVIAFVAIAMVSGSIVSVYAMNKSSVEINDAPQVEIVDTVQAGNEKTVQAEIMSAVQTDEVTFTCRVAGCTQTGEHSHGGNSGDHHHSGHGGGHH